MSAKLAIPGVLVTKASQNLPQTATANLFTVAGGTVLVTGLLGVVTTVIGGTATTLALGTAPGAATTAIATATAITSKTVGTVLAPVGASGVGVALIVGGSVFVQSPPLALSPFVLGAGVTNITWTTSGSTTGQVQWYLWYQPIDFDAAVS